MTDADTACFDVEGLPFAVAVSVAAPGWATRADLTASISAALSAALQAVEAEFVAGSELSLLLTDDDGIGDLNRDYRGKDRATNVLSFPGDRAANGAFGPLIGDIVLSLTTLRREATATDVPLTHHLAHLIVHGFLHILGYDHVTDEDAAVMECLEGRILASLGIADPHRPIPA